MPIHLDSQSADFAARFAALLAAKRETAEHRHPAAQARGLRLLRRSGLVRRRLLLRRLGRRGGRRIVGNASLHTSATGATQAPCIGVFHGKHTEEHYGAQPY